MLARFFGLLVVFFLAYFDLQVASAKLARGASEVERLSSLARRANECVGAQEDKKRTGTVVGSLKSQKNTKDDRNTIIEVLAPGEEKARSYHVQYDAKIKGPIPGVLKAVRAAKVGDIVELEWVDTNHGP